ncbi:MAG: hypothetical protein U1F18_06110 [Steroidobacteraceae bacterium]
MFIIRTTINTLTLYLATYFWQFGPRETEHLLVANTVGTFVGAAARALADALAREEAADGARPRPAGLACWRSPGGLAPAAASARWR